LRLHPLAENRPIRQAKSPSCYVAKQHKLDSREAAKAEKMNNRFASSRLRVSPKHSTTNGACRGQRYPNVCQTMIC